MKTRMPGPKEIMPFVWIKSTKSHDKVHDRSLKQASSPIYTEIMMKRNLLRNGDISVK